MSEFFQKLQYAFAENDIPQYVTDTFLSNYRLSEDGLFPEIALSEIPSNKCFTTLKVYCDTIGTPNILLIYQLLQIPFSEIQKTKNKLASIDPVLLKEFDGKHELFFTRPEFVDRLQDAFERRGLTSDEYLGVFPKALILGESAIERMNGVFTLLKAEDAKRIIISAASWYVYEDSIGLISECDLFTRSVLNKLTRFPNSRASCIISLALTEVGYARNRVAEAKKQGFWVSATYLSGVKHDLEEVLRLEYGDGKLDALVEHCKAGSPVEDHDSNALMVELILSWTPHIHLNIGKAIADFYPISDRKKKK